jgi:hypothetical protein
MANSALLARLPIAGTVKESSGPDDAFKIPLLSADGKFDPSLISNSSAIYSADDAADRLTQPADPGDFCTQSDTDSLFFLKAAPPSIESNWVQLSTVSQPNPSHDHDTRYYKKSTAIALSIALA